MGNDHHKVGDFRWWLSLEGVKRAWGTAWFPLLNTQSVCVEEILADMGF